MSRAASGPRSRPRPLIGSTLGKVNAVAPDRGHSFVISAFVAAVVAVGIVAFAPLGTTGEGTVEEVVPPADESSTAPEPVAERRSTSIVQKQGWGVVVRIGIPVVLVAAAPLFAPTGRSGRVLRFTSTILLFAGVVLGALSVGLFLLPAAVLMLIAAMRSDDPPVRA